MLALTLTLLVFIMHILCYTLLLKVQILVLEIKHMQIKVQANSACSLATHYPQWVNSDALGHTDSVHTTPSSQADNQGSTLNQNTSVILISTYTKTIVTVNEQYLYSSNNQCNSNSYTQENMHKNIIHLDTCSYRILNVPSQITESVVVVEIKQKEKP